MAPPAFPAALGVLYCDPAPSYDSLIHDQLAAAQKGRRNKDLNALLRRGHTWQVAGQAQA